PATPPPPPRRRATSPVATVGPLLARSGAIATRTTRPGIDSRRKHTARERPLSRFLYRYGDENGWKWMNNRDDLSCLGSSWPRPPRLPRRKRADRAHVRRSRNKTSAASSAYT